MEPLYLILIISGAGPIIGSAIGIIRRPSEHFLYSMLAFAAGVMLTLSFMELLPESIGLSGIWISAAGLLLGAITMWAVDRIIPHIHPELCRQEHDRNLKRTALYLLLGIFLHNLPEGIAIAIGTITSYKLSLTIAIAIAVHNIPEGICTSSPYYYSTKKRLEAFLLSSSTAIPIVVGFLLGRIVFQNIPITAVSILIAATAGIMIYISGDELIPISCSRDHPGWNHTMIFSLIAGVMFVMVLGAF